MAVNSPDFACGQVIFSLKSSRLNYIVNETPYSAYITIRKKFMTDITESQENHVIDQVNVNVADNAVKNENVVLKKELNDLKTTFAMATVQFEELEIKNESLQKEIVSLDDKLEEAYHEVRNSKEDLSKLNIEKNKLIEMLDDRADRTSCTKE